MGFTYFLRFQICYSSKLLENFFPSKQQERPEAVPTREGKDAKNRTGKMKETREKKNYVIVYNIIKIFEL